MSDGEPAPGEVVTNHFVHRASAERYHKHRPVFHPRVIEAIRERLKLSEPLPVALDVGCGTGHSAVALRAIARRVIGVDASPAMLAAATPTAGVEYVCANAESLPFADASFPVITVSMAMHWFDRSRFLAEASRLLTPGGWLVLYGYNYTRVMHDEPGFPAWVKEQLLRRYPLTSRNGNPETDAEIARHGLILRDRTEFVETRSYSVESYVQQVLTHSYVIHRIENGEETVDEAAHWLRDQLTPFFHGAAERAFEFAGWTNWVQKPAA